MKKDFFRMILSWFTVFSVIQLLNAQPPFRFSRRGPAVWGNPNEIYGNGPRMTSTTSSVLIAGHPPSFPPVTRPVGRLRYGPRSRPTSTTILSSSSSPPVTIWPGRPSQIQRAKETSHFEYEVIRNPNNRPRPQPPAPPVILRPVSTRMPPRPPVMMSPVPTRMSPRPPVWNPPSVPSDITRILAQDFLLTSPRPQRETDRPLTVVTSLPAARSPSPPNESFQEGLRILKDLMAENYGADIRSNLVGGSALSFNAGNLPVVQKANVSLHLASNSTASKGPYSPTVQMTPAKQSPLLIAAPVNVALPQHSPANAAKSPPLQRKPQMQQSASSFNYPLYRPGPSPAHVSFMFSDPGSIEIPDGYNLYDNDLSVPPPPFHPSGGNSINFHQSPNYEDESDEKNQPNFVPPPSPSRPQYMPPQRQHSNNDGYRNIPEVSIRPSINLSGYNYNTSSPILAAIPVKTKAEAGGAVPSSEEVQKALNILARFATKQNPALTMMMAQLQKNQFGEMSTSVPVYAPPSTTQRPEAAPHTSQLQQPRAHSSTTEAPKTVAASQTEESSPFPSYGAPGYGPPAPVFADGSYTSAGGYGGFGNFDVGGIGSGWTSSTTENSGVASILGAKVQALKTIQSAVTGGFKQITGLKTGILNAGLNAIDTLGKAKSDFSSTLKFPIVAQTDLSKEYGAPQSPGPAYGAPAATSGWTQTEEEKKPSPVGALFNGVREVVGGLAGTVAQTGRAAVGIGLSNKRFVSNHFAIKGHAFTDTVAKNFANKNQYFQDVLKHIQSIFDSASTKKPSTTGWGWRR